MSLLGLMVPAFTSSLIHWATSSRARAEPMRSLDFSSGCI